MAEQRDLVIAIDGPAGAGKSTVAQMVAQKLQYLYLDTGAMYRAVTYLVVKRGVNPDDENAVTETARQADIELKSSVDGSGKPRVFVNGEEITDKIRTREISNLVSPLSAIASVRSILVDQQRKLAAGGKVVLDGRDIGTVVLPNADVKIFLTASSEERARRRLKDLEKSGETADFQELLAEIEARDKRDSTREVAPLKVADGGIVVDTDSLTIDQVVGKILDICATKN
ncbi:MAG: (d)CMP kinase [Candidatus Obscuribacterales bacterium]|nr:(d)CMP kinase [Candidatus Obscuribacterales bacterium]